MSKRILIAECKQEVSTFNPNLSRLSDFGIRRGHEIIDYHRTVRNEIAGSLSVFDKEKDVELIPTYSAFFITSGGTLAQSDWLVLANDFLDAVRKGLSQGDIDGIYFCMHGAMCSEQEYDPEGYLLEQTRAIAGEKIPIVVSLDLHGIATRKMFKHADAIVAYQTYPHVDFFETGARAARLLMRILKDGVKPVTARIPIPALVRGDELITETGLFGECMAVARILEGGDKCLSSGIFIGNPFTDVPELGTYCFVTTNDDEFTAKELALSNAKRFWSFHEKMQVPLISLSQMQRKLMESRGGTVALVDAADATSSGATGDSNAVLKALIECGYLGRTLIPIVDRAAAEQANRAGIGAEVTVCLGGSLDPGRYEPIELSCRVRHLSDGLFRSESFGELWDSGLTAVLETGPFTIVVSSRGVNLYDRSFFYNNGQDPKQFDAVVVKSPHCQHHMYAKWCKSMLMVDAPGASSANLHSLGHQRCQRPIFPLDDIREFDPKIEIYRRQAV
jgi:microcystin degradation protein MlrC